MEVLISEKRAVPLVAEKDGRNVVAFAVKEAGNFRTPGQSENKRRTESWERFIRARWNW